MPVAKRSLIGLMRSRCTLLPRWKPATGSTLDDYLDVLNFCGEEHIRICPDFTQDVPPEGRMARPPGENWIRLFRGALRAMQRGAIRGNQCKQAGWS